MWTTTTTSGSRLNGERTAVPVRNLRRPPSQQRPAATPQYAPTAKAQFGEDGEEIKPETDWSHPYAISAVAIVGLYYCKMMYPDKFIICAGIVGLIAVCTKPKEFIVTGLILVLLFKFFIQTLL